MGVAPALITSAVNVTEFPVQIELPRFDEIEMAGEEVPVTVMVIELEVAVVVDKQDALLVSTQVTICPLVSVVVEYVLLFVPTFVPFTFHWYDGVAPPLVGTAVNVTFDPEQMLFPGFAEIVTEGVTNAVTVIVSVLETTTSLHPPVCVIVQVMVFPFASPASV